MSNPTRHKTAKGYKLYLQALGSSQFLNVLLLKLQSETLEQLLSKGHPLL